MKEILERYASVHNLKTQVEISDRLGVSESALSNQKARGSLKSLEAIIKTSDPDVNLDWILTGRGSPKINENLRLVDEKFSRYESSLDEIDKSDIDQGDFLEFVRAQQEALLSFLYKIEKSDRSND